MYLLLSAAGGKDKDMYFNQVEFGQRIKEERNRLGLTQEELAEQLNIGSVHVYNIESGRKGCSIDLLLEFAELFEVSTDYLLTGKGNMNAEIREHLQGAIDELEGLLQGISRK
jgi:transcriptional regulator with XRE-family HTH domain